jgi:FkbM family methyltransferase
MPRPWIDGLASYTIVDISVSTERQLEWYAKNVDLRGAFCVDVGANIGVVSQFLYDQGARVLSVEPIGANVDALRQRVEAAGASDRWTVVQGAVTDATARVTLRARHDARQGWNSIVSAHPPPTEHLEVDGWRLHELAPDATFVKVDVEGHEYRILDDALLHMPHVRAWAIELHMVAGRPLPRVFEQFAAAGFEVMAATAKRGDPKGSWHSVRVPATLDWPKVPVARRRPDGSVFKMLHVLACRS